MNKLLKSLKSPVINLRGNEWRKKNQLERHRAASEIEQLRLENERLRKMFGEMPAAWSDKINQAAEAALKQE